MTYQRSITLGCIDIRIGKLETSVQFFYSNAWMKNQGCIFLRIKNYFWRAGRKTEKIGNENSSFSSFYRTLNQLIFPKKIIYFLQFNEKTLTSGVKRWFQRVGGGYFKQKIYIPVKNVFMFCFVTKFYLRNNYLTCSQDLHLF